jgi:hypothetical protein
MSYESNKSGRDIIQGIEKMFGNNALIDVAAISQAEGLVWPNDATMQEFVRLFDMRILGEIAALPHSFMIAIKYQVLFKLFTSNIPHQKWISSPPNMPETRFLCGTDVGKCLTFTNTKLHTIIQECSSSRDGQLK